MKQNILKPVTIQTLQPSYEPNAENTHLSPDSALRLALCFVASLQDTFGLAQKGRPGRRQLNAAIAAQKQLRPDFLFQVENCLADSRLSHIEAAGRFAVAEVLGHRAEVAQMSEFHS